MRKRNWLTAIAGLPLLATTLAPTPAAHAAAPIQVILNGKAIPLTAPVVVQQDRTLIPIRDLTEAMGATVTWDNDNRTASVTRGQQFVRVKIDRRLACLTDDCVQAATLEVPTQLIDSRTYVPVRFLSQSLGVFVDWDNDRRAVILDTTKPPVPQPNHVSLAGVNPGQIITGPITLKANAPKGNRAHFYLIDPATGKGPMVAAGMDSQGSYTFTPDPTITGVRLLVAGAQDEAGVYRYSDPVPVVMMPEAKVQVTGADWNGIIDGVISFGSEVNFVATHVTFKLINAASGAVLNLGTVGAGDKVTYYPQVSEAGDWKIEATAYDRNGKAYVSQAIPVKVLPVNRAYFYGLENGDVLTNGTATFEVTRNFQVDSVKYILDDRVLGWGYKYTFKYGPELNGAHTLRVEVGGADGSLKTFGPFNFTINYTPKLWLTGVGPDAVISSATTIGVTSNETITAVDYYLRNDLTGNVTLLASKTGAQATSWTPTASGKYTIYAVGKDSKGRTLTTDKVSFRTYVGKLYEAKPLVQKDAFLDLASRLSVPVYRDIGMSAAIQVAQAILETGWGQKHPVDKYTGQYSYNLFGIKGTGPAGSVVSTTWEVYNGKNFTVDANFRAYHSIEESWRDHADFLLERPWYAPFRAVMAEPIQGAWALRRSGYATDPAYPVKLINIMKQNDLFKLDEVEL